MSATTNTTSARVPACSCAHNRDGTITAFLCPIHAEDDPCLDVAALTGKRRRGSVVRGCCSHCGWASNARKEKDAEREAERVADWLATYSAYCD